MKICLSGGTGFIGSQVTGFFKNKGFEVENISRLDLKQDLKQWKYKVDGADILINMAGAPIFKKWTPEYKKIIKESRVETTKKISEALLLSDNKPPLVISISAVGIYDNYNVHEETSNNLSADFLGEVCKEWESAIISVSSQLERLLIFRMGIVLGKEGGALGKMLPAFKMGVGAVIGSGTQVFPYIHMSDFLSALWFVYENKEMQGVYNMVSPNTVTNKRFSKLLGQKLKRPVLFKIPKWILKLLLGDGHITLVEGQTVKPVRLLKSGFVFQYPTIERVLDNLV